MSRIRDGLLALGCFSVSLMFLGSANITPDASTIVFNWGLGLLVTTICLYTLYWLSENGYLKGRGTV